MLPNTKNPTIKNNNSGFILEKQTTWVTPSVGTYPLA